ncbi:PQQ-dependent sugar dehydrogenase [Methyloglobulus sp.]|uniref:PQQ-dependent sugar dehydrogenase n=1 Tax=Methyloglobulus sp. TaxID=2518622 RepID=UPI003989F1EC
MNKPVEIAHAGDERLFVVEQPGLIRIIDDNGNLLGAPFLDIQSRVDDSGSEMGLLGLAFHPDYAANSYFYVYYTRNTGASLIRTRIARFEVSSDPNVADANSEQVIMEFEQPFAIHNGGALHFGPDGYLYIASGDGGGSGDPQNHAQNNHVLLGKMIRIDVNGPAGANDGPDCDISGNRNYRIPPSNTFDDGTGGLGCDEIYASGLRNPWRFSFDRQTGDLWIADVGQSAYEEIDFILSGAVGGLNFGWRCFEGNQTFNSSGCSGNYFFPVHEYPHTNGNCSVTGGYVYRGSVYPALTGHYFYTDFCNPAIQTLSGSPSNPVVSQVLPSGGISTPSSFGEDFFGELYIARDLCTDNKNPG